MSDIINIQALRLQDTFEDWFNKTNDEVIHHLNLLNLYDVSAGEGIAEDRGPGGDSGVVTLSVKAGDGLGFDGNNYLVIDITGLTLMGALSVANDDEILIADASDGGRLKKVNAQYMLPPNVTVGEFASGKGMTISGDVVITGDLNVVGTATQTNLVDLAVTDKTIELHTDGADPAGPGGDDVSADGGGIIVKSTDGDHSWLWIRGLDAWSSEANIATANGGTLFVSNIEGHANNVNLVGDGENDVLTIRISDSTTDKYWQIVRSHDEDDNKLKFGFHDGITLTEHFNLNGTTGFAEGFDSDLLDGAHATVTPTPNSIPVSKSDGKLDSGWFENIGSVSELITKEDHGFAVGDVLRIDDEDGWVKAQADNAENAEVAGIVDLVPDANTFRIVYGGIARNLSDLATSEVYFLSAEVAGALTTEPPTGIGEVRKAVLLATSGTTGIVTNYLGTTNADPTDTAYIDGLVPVGAIYPYVGNLEDLSQSWLHCNGDAISKNSYPQLSSKIGENYYAEVTLTQISATSATLDFTGGTRNLSEGDKLTVKWGDAADEKRINMDIADISGNIITVSGGSGYNIPSGSRTVKVHAVGLKCFLPDLRGRAAIGAGTGDGLTTRTLMGIGGAEEVTLTINQMPDHTHTIDGSISGAGGTTQRTLTGTSSPVQSGSSGEGDPHPNMPPYSVVHWIIRASEETNVRIITGHDHDTRYFRFDDVQGIPINQTHSNRFRSNALITKTDIRDEQSDFFVRYDAEQTLSSSEKYQARANIGAMAADFADSQYVSYAGLQELSLPQKHNALLNISALWIGAGVNYPLQGDLYMNNFKIVGLKDPTVTTDAANKRYVDTAIENRAVRYDITQELTYEQRNNVVETLNVLSRTGGTLTGALVMSNNRIAQLAPAQFGTDAINRDQLYYTRDNLLAAINDLRGDMLVEVAGAKAYTDSKITYRGYEQEHSFTIDESSYTIDIGFDWDWVFIWVLSGSVGGSGGIWYGPWSIMAGDIDYSANLEDGDFDLNFAGLSGTGPVSAIEIDGMENRRYIRFRASSGPAVTATIRVKAWKAF